MILPPLVRNISSLQSAIVSASKSADWKRMDVSVTHRDTPMYVCAESTDGPFVDVGIRHSNGPSQNGRLAARVALRCASASLVIASTCRCMCMLAVSFIPVLLLPRTFATAGRLDASSSTSLLCASPPERSSSLPAFWCT